MAAKKHNQWIEGRDEPSTFGTLAFLMLGLIIWALQLTLVYGAHTLVCRSGGPANVAYWLVVGFSLLAFAIAAAALIYPSGIARLFGLTNIMLQRPSYLIIFRAVIVISLAAIAWTGFLPAVLTACVQAR